MPANNRSDSINRQLKTTFRIFSCCGGIFSITILPLERVNCLCVSVFYALENIETPVEVWSTLMIYFLSILSAWKYYFRILSETVVTTL